jgi:hypothetical protein
MKTQLYITPAQLLIGIVALAVMVFLALQVALWHCEYRSRTEEARHRQTLRPIVCGNHPEWSVCRQPLRLFPFGG